MENQYQPRNTGYRPTLDPVGQRLLQEGYEAVNAGYFGDVDGHSAQKQRVKIGYPMRMTILRKCVNCGRN